VVVAGGGRESRVHGLGQAMVALRRADHDDELGDRAVLVRMEEVAPDLSATDFRVEDQSVVGRIVRSISRT
jgi:hypothetical protein